MTQDQLTAFINKIRIEPTQDHAIEVTNFYAQPSIAGLVTNIDTHRLNAHISVGEDTYVFRLLPFPLQVDGERVDMVFVIQEVNNNAIFFITTFDDGASLYDLTGKSAQAILAYKAELRQAYEWKLSQIPAANS